MRSNHFHSLSPEHSTNLFKNSSLKRIKYSPLFENSEVVADNLMSSLEQTPTN